MVEDSRIIDWAREEIGAEMQVSRAAFLFAKNKTPEAYAQALIDENWPLVRESLRRYHFKRGYERGEKESGYQRSFEKYKQHQTKKKTSAKVEKRKDLTDIYNDLPKLSMKTVKFLINERGFSSDIVDAIYKNDFAKESDPQRHKNYYTKGYRLVIPLYDKNKIIRSVKIRSTSKHTELKTTSPKIPTSGLVCDNLIDSRDIVLVEGEMDFLIWAGHTQSVRVIGIFSGSVQEDFCDFIPKNSNVFLRLDADKAGNRYVIKIIESLKRRDDLILVPRNHSRHADDCDFFKKEGKMPTLQGDLFGKLY